MRAMGRWEIGLAMFRPETQQFRRTIFEELNRNNLYAGKLQEDKLKEHS